MMEAPIEISENKEIVHSFNELQAKIVSKYGSNYKLAVVDIALLDDETEKNQYIINLVMAAADFFNVPQPQITCKNRIGDKACEVRFICWFMIKEHYGEAITLSFIASKFGHRDHSTIINGINKIKMWTDPNSRFKNAKMISKLLKFKEYLTNN